MKKVLVCKEVLDELDFVEMISKLLDQPLPENGYNVIMTDLEKIEYEDSEHQIHHASEICGRVMRALGFYLDESIKKNFDSKNKTTYIYKKDNLLFGTKTDYKRNKFIIQRQK